MLFTLFLLFILFMLIRKGKKQQTAQPERTISYHKKFNVAGVTYKCKLDKDCTRQGVLDSCWTSDKLHLQEFTYKGKPAFLIVRDKNNKDIGCVPQNLVDTIVKYRDRECEVVFDKIDCFTNDRGKDIIYATVQFKVYKDK